MFFAIYKTKSFVSEIYASENEDKLLSYIEEKMIEYKNETIFIDLYKQAEGEKIQVYKNPLTHFDPKLFIYSVNKWNVTNWKLFSQNDFPKTLDLTEFDLPLYRIHREYNKESVEEKFIEFKCGNICFSEGCAKTVCETGLIFAMYKDTLFNTWEIVTEQKKNLPFCYPHYRGMDGFFSAKEKTIEIKQPIEIKMFPLWRLQNFWGTPVNIDNQ